jgi:hypothetical protein
MLLRLAEVIYAPLYALFLVGPAALLVEMWWSSRAPKGAAAQPESPAAEYRPSPQGV